MHSADQVPATRIINVSVMMQLVDEEINGVREQHEQEQGYWNERPR